ncbi:MAG: hypothetical protein HLUCCA11_14265 [Phormidesmis priestleyi Ana]|uniref:Uncharacterized protein n=1 Tax=Phormidesmis priestleyi Ana TaxID=1666911 RepID=A0A0N8KMU0_9CYAN|nr:MAG: hypothetical protein HLUCCA11_14265 [Phormidesmis priestleyi Ana]
MAIVFGLLIVGWLVAFALGAQAGFDNQPAAAQPSPAQSVSQRDLRGVEATTYREPASMA